MESVPFAEACRKAGGKYTEENGYLEGDVGEPHGVESFAARKEWCEIQGDRDAVNIFYAPRRKHLEVKVGTKGFEGSQRPYGQVEMDSGSGWRIRDAGEFGGKGICFEPRGKVYPTICVDSPSGGIRNPDFHVRDLVL